MHQPATAKEFVKAWQESSSLAEVAHKLRTKKNALRVRAFRYRKMGVPLKVFPPVVYEVMNWNQLAAYARKILKTKEST